ncbi:MAG: hypothetical protein AAF849_18690 [Bacteroidota bacterium]
MIVKEIAKIIHSKKINLLPTLIGLKADSVLKKMHHIFTNDKVSSDEEASRLLYKKDKNRKSKYTKLKYNYKQRLYHTALLVDITDDEKTQERKKAFFSCARAWLIGYFLILIQARRSGIAYLEHSIADMLRYEFTMLAIESCKILRQHYGVMKGNSEQYKKYDQLIQNLLPLYLAETKAEGYYHYLMSHYVQNKASKDFIFDMAKEYQTSLNLDHLEQRSSSLIYKSKMIEIIKHLSVFEYRKVANVCEEAVKLLKARAFIDNTGLATIYYQWIIACTQIKEYEQAKVIAEQVIQYTMEGAFNWFKGMEVLAQLSFHLGDYDSVLTYFLEVTQHKNYPKMQAVIREEWTIYGAYLRFLVAAGKLEDTKQVLSSIKLAKFVNEVPILSKDKSGKNIPIFICYLVSLIQLKRYDELIDQAENYKKYLSRYLKEEEHLRTYQFIRMLLVIPATSMECTQIEVQTRSFKKVLMERPVDVFNINYISEVIPYERLWEIVLELVCDPSSD